MQNPPTEPAPPAPGAPSGGSPTTPGDRPPPTMEELHADPRHWRFGIFYVCREDPRVIVPKRIRGLGWTLNFARRAMYVWAVILYLFIWSTVALAKAAGASHEALLTLKVVMTFGILFFCYRAANASGGRKP